MIDVICCLIFGGHFWIVKCLMGEIFHFWRQAASWWQWGGLKFITTRKVLLIRLNLCVLDCDLCKVWPRSQKLRSRSRTRSWSNLRSRSRSSFEKISPIAIAIILLTVNKVFFISFIGKLVHNHLQKWVFFSELSLFKLCHFWNIWPAKGWLLKKS